MRDGGKRIVTIGYIDTATLVVKQKLGRGDTFENLSEAVTDAVTSQCDLGDEFYFSFNLDEPWVYDEYDGSLYIEKVDSSPTLRIGLQSRKSMKAWIPRFKEAMESLPDAQRIPDLWRALPDRTGDEAD